MDLEKFLLIHNEYAAPSGEEIELARVRAILVGQGHGVESYGKRGDPSGTSALEQLRAGMAGIYSSASRREVGSLLERFKPHYALVQNLFPHISPAVLPVIAEAGVPILMRVANYRLMCPNGLHLSHGKICERCLHGREYWCVLKNCEENVFKSSAYAARSAIARVKRWYRDNVAAYLCASSFLRDRMVAAGF
jgi:hypothetical protein